MRILYCNLRSKWTVEGHKYFDVKWVHLLGKLADVTVLAPRDDWYEDVNENINKVVYDAGAIIEDKWVSWKIWKNSQLKRLGVKDHVEAGLYIRKVVKLYKSDQYDYIVIGTLDLISYYLNRNKLRKAGRLVLLVHSIEGLGNGIVGRIFDRVKNDFMYIVMEKDGINYMHELYGVNKAKIYHIPHMLNLIECTLNESVMPYDIVGISNSNDETEVQKIVDLEKSEKFFEKNGLTSIIRAKNIEYESKGLKVFRGRLSLSYDEYYTYIMKARLIILPFSDQFGLRSSGTIMDAFSQNIPILGNGFRTMVQYSRHVPDICKIYSSMDEFKRHVLEMVNETDRYDEEYRMFQDSHSDEVIVNQMIKLFR